MLIEACTGKQCFVTSTRRPSVFFVTAFAECLSIRLHPDASVPARTSVFAVWRLLFSLLRGDGEIRTHDPLLARQVLSQLSYTPRFRRSGSLPEPAALCAEISFGNHRLCDGHFASNLLLQVRSYDRALNRSGIVDPASTCSPTSSPMQYHRPLKS